ncbi:MAG: cytochrome c biogenesis protein CcsA [Ignavibacteriales bacterium]|nr:cytochrome c biogenesis protein CcsA [Ignavibacteriales bacterium]
MNIGHITIIIAFLASMAAMIFYFIEARKNNQPSAGKTQSSLKREIAKRIYYLSVGFGLIAGIVLYYALFTHQFQYSYVAHYSSSDLSTFYIISSFWAGQEGTFLLWALLVGVMGIVFIRSTKSDDPYTMSVVSLFNASLYLLLISKSPFELTIPAPLEGNGLNPLLQDPWMVIHPPILFVGYAATIFPFGLVVSGLIRRNYTNWNKLGLSWSLFAAVMLGAGIIIGGFWAYEVLGWGGYWGWDPVENSSLVPWLVLLALIHGILIHRAKGSLQRTNMFLALLSFILVVYATFLTRSGILANFSVHSFADLGLNNYLIGMMLASIVIGLGFFAVRFSEIKSNKIDASGLNREVTLLISMYVILAAAAFTFVGMSSPIITGLLGNASQVDISFYNKVNFPVAIAMAILLGIVPFLSWMEDKKGNLLKRFSMPLALTVLGCAIAYVAGVTSWTLLLFVGSAVFGLVVNVIVTFRQYRTGWLHIGGPISHIGVSLMLIGIIGSGKFDESKQIILKQNEPQTLYGYQFTFKGVSDPQALKPLMNIEVSDGKTSFMATPKLYFSNYNQAVMREPDIKVLPLKDLYISPLELQADEHQHGHDPMMVIAKGETQEFMGYKITFTKFDVGQHGMNAMMSVGAVLNIEANGKTEEIIPVLSFNEKNERVPVPVDLPVLSGYNNMSGQKPQIALTALSVEEKKVELAFLGFTAHENHATTQALVVDISLKPLMMVVWTGVVLVILGTVIAFRRRTLQKDLV